MNCDQCGGRLSAMRVRDARIVEMAQRGKTRKEIISELGLTPGIVYKVIFKSGVKPGKARMRPMTAAGVDEVAKMIAGGMTQIQIAEHFGVSKSTVQKFVIENGMRQRSRRKDAIPGAPLSYDYGIAKVTQELFHRPLNALRAA
jgi:DNA-binding CsgD family transcriptional regulator